MASFFRMARLKRLLFSSSSTMSVVLTILHAGLLISMTDHQLWLSLRAATVMAH